MFNVCQNCGQYRADKVIDPCGPLAICPECEHPHPFQLHPLLLIGGASGTGKTAVLQQLLGDFTAAVLLEGDLLWRAEFNQPEDNYRNFFETWLRVCKNIGQSGRPVALFNAGAAVPDNIEPCVERRYFSQVHYLALTCEDEILSERLRARPTWRDSGSPEFIAGQLQFNQWLKDQGPQSAVELLDTSKTSIAATTHQVAAWITSKLDAGTASVEANLRVEAS